MYIKINRSISLTHRNKTLKILGNRTQKYFLKAYIPKSSLDDSGNIVWFDHQHLDIR